MQHKKADPGQLISNMHSLALLTKKISWMSAPTKAPFIST